MQRRILCSIGTRPEAIKMAPVVKELQRQSWAQCRVVASGQHRELLHRSLDGFAITPDIVLDVMQDRQALSGLMARLLTALDDVLVHEKPHFVLAQGDTTTVLATAIAAFHRQIPFGHVEAGLRTHVRTSPFPEEANRLLTAQITSQHFAVTARGRENLLREGIGGDTVHVVGNTVIDALLMTARQLPPADGDTRRRKILITAHRRENHGEPLEQICAAIARLCVRFSDVEFVWPLHPNPRVREIVRKVLGGNPRIRLCEPLDYTEMVRAMRECTLILTDSGGIQEEAPALGKPVLILRDHTERPEAVEAGVAKLVGTQCEAIEEGVAALLGDAGLYTRMSQGNNPFGDGQASVRIIQILERILGVADDRPQLGEFQHARMASSRVGK